MTTPAAPLPAHDPAALRAVFGSALVLALFTLGLYLPTLLFPALEVSDAALLEARSLQQAWWQAGLGGVAVFLEDPGQGALLARVVALGLLLGSSLLVFVLGLRLGLARSAAFFLALLFALHPMQIEAVAWLSQRSQLIGVFAFLLGTVLALETGRAARSTRGIAANAALCLALVAEPRLLLLLPWLVFAERRARTSAEKRRLVGRDTVWLLLVGFVLLVILRRIPLEHDDWKRVGSLPLSILSLLGQGLWPASLSPSRGAPSGLLAAGWVNVLGWIALLPASVLLARRARQGSMSALAGFLLLLSTLAFAALPSSPAPLRESEALLPLLGLLLVVVLAVHATLAHPRARSLVLGAMLVALALRTGLRLPAWSSERALQEAALLTRPDDRNASAALGRWHFLHGRLSTAQTHFERLLANDPQDALGLLGMGELELRRAQLPGAEQRMLLAASYLARATEIPRAGALLGEVLLRSGDAPAALEHLERAVLRTPYDAIPRSRLGMARLSMRDIEGAGLAFERATELDPRSVDAWCGLGIARQQAGEVARAEAAFERALALEPDHVESNANLGDILEQRGESAAAERHYRRAVGVNPDNVDALYLLGKLLSGSQRKNEALRTLEHIVALRSGRPHVRATLEAARILIERGEHERARERLRAVLGFNPEQAEARALLDALPSEAQGQ